MNKFRSWQFVAALVFLLAAVSFTVGDDGVQWMWRETPVVGAALAVASLVFWVLLAREAARDRATRPVAGGGRGAGKRAGQ